MKAKSMIPVRSQPGQPFIDNDLRKTCEVQKNQLSVRKADEGVSWGSIHWQYLEDMSKVTPHEDTP
jgi:hypothetical protein